MTSKKGLRVLTGIVFNSVPFDFKDADDAWQAIENDLNMLELIKAHYQMNNFGELVPRTIDCSKIDDFEKIKDWING